MKLSRVSRGFVFKLSSATQTVNGFCMWLHDSCMWLCDTQWVSESTDPRWCFNKTPPNGSVYTRIYPSYRRLSLILRPTILSVLPSRWPIVALWLWKAIRRIRPVEVTEQMSLLDSKAFEICPFLLDSFYGTIIVTTRSPTAKVGQSISGQVPMVFFLPSWRPVHT